MLFQVLQTMQLDEGNDRHAAPSSRSLPLHNDVHPHGSRDEDRVSHRYWCCPLAHPQTSRERTSAEIDVHDASSQWSSISTYGTNEFPLNYGPKRYSWKFVVADVFMPIIGADFLYFYSLAVDVRYRRLLPTSPHIMKHGATPPQSFSAAAADPFDALLTEFADVFSETLPSLAKKPHGIQHHIVTKGPQSTPSSAACPQRSSKQPRRSSKIWSPRAFARKPPAPGPLPSTWSQKRMAPTDPATTTHVSTT